jgi:FkbM family methyltransferase
MYSQCGEDQILNDNIFKNKRNGIFLEMGALDGVLYSNTKFFEDSLGWTGILIEPNPVQFELLKKNRPNCKLYNNLVSDIDDELDFRYFLDGHAAVSGVKDSLAESHKKAWFDNPEFGCLPQAIQKMKPRTLTDIIKDSGVSHIDFFSLDVEGHELNVLKSYDFSVPIDIILIETIDEKKTENYQCAEILIRKGFRKIGNIGCNDVYRHRHVPFWLKNRK